MYSISGVHRLPSPPIPRIYQHADVDKESLLVAFLSELIYYLELEQIGFDQFDLDLSERSIVAMMEGSQVSGLKKNIKAVTYHNLEILSTAEGFEVEIVFDV